MKPINNITNFQILSKSRTIISAAVLILILSVSYFTYDFINNSYESGVADPLNTRQFTILSDLKKDAVNFSKINVIFERLFDYTTEINVNIIPSTYEGRYNPFSI